MDWKSRLHTFMSHFPYKDEVTGVLVSGSFITGFPNKNSDLDVNLITENKNLSRHGKKIVDGLIIDYFLNSADKLEAQFQSDFQVNNLLKHTQFATGEIIFDKTGDTERLKCLAINRIHEYYDRPVGTDMSDKEKHRLWDMLDDLEQMYDSCREDFSFIYFNYLNTLLCIYMNSIRRPYRLKAIYGNIVSEVVRNKYLLRALPHPDISDLIKSCITSHINREQLDLYSQLTKCVFSHFGGFDVDAYTRDF